MGEPSSERFLSPSLVRLPIEARGRKKALIAHSYVFTPLSSGTTACPGRIMWNRRLEQSNEKNVPNRLEERFAESRSASAFASAEKMEDRIFEGRTRGREREREEALSSHRKNSERKRAKGKDKSRRAPFRETLRAQRPVHARSFTIFRSSKASFLALASTWSVAGVSDRQILGGRKATFVEPKES